MYCVGDYRDDHDLGRWVASARCIINQLPTPNKVLLQELCVFLAEVAQHADVNAMNKTNLATCLGPNLLRGKEDASLQELLDLSALVTRFMLKCLEDVDQLFPAPMEKREEQVSTEPETTLHRDHNSKGNTDDTAQQEGTQIVQEET